METLESRWGRAVIRYRWAIIFVSLITVAVAATGGRFLRFTTDYRVFFSEDNPQLLAFEAMEKIYSKNDNVLFVLAPKQGEVFTPDFLSVVEALTEQAWQIPYSSRVDSISNFQHTEALEDDLSVEDLIENAAGFSDSQIAKVKDIAIHEPLLQNRLIAARSHATAINVTVQLPGADESKEVPEVVSHVRQMVSDLAKTAPDISVYVTGMVMMNNAFSEASKGDMKTLVPVSVIIMMVALMILLGSVGSTLLVVFVILFSIVAAMGLGGYIGFPITAPSATAPTVILTMAIANCVHILVSFIHSVRHGRQKIPAIQESLRINLQPVFLASLTTCLGFLSMNFSDAPPFRHLGNFVAIGVAISFLLSVTFLPAMLSFFPIRETRAKASENSAMQRFGQFIVQQRTPLLWGMLAVIVSLMAFIPKNELNDVFLHYFDESIKFRRDSDFITENLTGFYRIEYSLSAGRPGAISEPGFLKDVEAFAEWFRTQPETMHVNVFTDIIKRLNKNMHGDDPDWYRLPEARDLSAQYLLLYEMSLPYGLDLNDQINLDKSALRVIVTCKTLSSNQVLALERRAAEWLTNNTSHIEADSFNGSGTTVMFANIGKRNIQSMLVGTTVALVLISIILIVALRSVKIGLVSMLPNLIPAGMGFGLWGIFVGEVGLSLSVVTGMTLGIVVDDTVHFLSKYLRARREKGLSSSDAVVYAFKTVGRALLVTSTVLIAGFLVLSLSSFELNSGMGLLTAIVIGFALMADFLFLPPLLIKIEERRHD